MLLARLFLEFLKIGMFSVGGGMATLPFLYDMADKTGWCTYAQIADMLAVSESTPGPIGINMATYVGYSIGGIPGALASTFGIILPGIFLVIIVTSVLDKFKNNVYVEGAFYGLRPASTALITAAGILVAKITFLSLDLYEMTGNALDIFNYKAVILAIVLLVLTRKIKHTKNLHPVVFIAASAVIGIVFSFGSV